MLLFLRIVGLFLQMVSPAYGSCYRCWWTWNYVTSHTTYYESTTPNAFEITPVGERIPIKLGTGVFPLCENCWRCLTPKQRLPYYKRMWDRWPRLNSEEDWERVKEAVLTEAV